MMVRRFALLAAAAVLCAGSPSEKLETFRVRENFQKIWVDSRAPYPPEISNEMQGRALAREAAVTLGQNELLRHVLQKRTRGGKTVAEAEVPSTEMQQNVRALIRGARVEKTAFTKEGCEVRVSVDKKNLKVILRKN